VRINSAVREKGLSYSSFINKLKKSDIALNRKMLAQLAVLDRNCFTTLVQLPN